jgi:Zn-dependent protease with chaperone function
MDFFEHQDAARRKTGLLVVLFVAAVLAIIASIYLVAGGLMAYGRSRTAQQDRFAPAPAITLWEPKLLVAVGLGTLLVVGGGSMFKISQLAGGGRVVAESLGGRLLNRGAARGVERKVLNVVEEMALAAGTAVPPVYYLDNERGINAFAAGTLPGNAVIGVTRGCAEELSRDELQGVMAHEFSHILNGDMRLNIRLIGVVHGILIIGLIGTFVFRSALYSGAVRRRSDKNNPLPLIVIGLALMAIGFLGTFFGNMIKAAVSRQREFLADAASVQFTRNPDSIAGALRKIGGLSHGSVVVHPGAPEASHMFFGEGIKSALGGLMATHPPLPQRIRRVDPGWNGRFVQAGTPQFEPEPTTRTAAGAGAAGAIAGLSAMASVGRPTRAHADYASQVVGDMPRPVLDAAHEPYGARAVVYALLIDTDAESRKVQFQRLAAHADEGVQKLTTALLPHVQQLCREARLPLIDLLMPALRSLSPDQYKSFRVNVAALIEADRKIHMLEWTLWRILAHHLDAHFGRSRPPRVRFHKLRGLEHSCAALLSALARSGHAEQRQIRDAFEAGTAHLGGLSVELRSPDACGPHDLERALDQLQLAAPRPKRRVLSACAACVAADRKVTVHEAEILRAVADVLDCPMPPLLPGQALI